jgi:phage tail-like protein
MTRRDPYLAFCFRVTITDAGLNESTGLFKSVSGLEVETEVVDFKEGGVNDYTHKLAGGTKFKNIVLKRGFSGSEFTNWRKKWESDKPSAAGQRLHRAARHQEQLRREVAVRGWLAVQVVALGVRREQERGLDRDPRDRAPRHPAHAVTEVIRRTA